MCIRDSVLAVPGTVDLHHLHVWQIDERRLSAEMHLVVADGADPYATLRAVKRVLGDSHGVVHSTIEVETSASGCADARGGQVKDDHAHPGSPDPVH